MIEATLSVSHLAGLFKKFRSMVKGQRYLILLGPDDRGEFVVAQAHGVDPERAFTTEPIGISLLQHVCQTRQPFLAECSADLIGFDTNTMLLSGIQSVLCLPILGTESQVLGLLYADDLRRERAFQYTDQLNAMNLLKGLNTQPRPQLQPARSLPAAPKKAVAATAKSRLRLSARDQAAFFLQLATFIRSGIPILRGLQALSQQSESGPISQLAERMLTGLEKGGSLAAVLDSVAVFPPFVVGQLAAAEISGQLALSLDLLARHLEQRQKRWLKLQASLAYPCFLSLLCLLVVGLLPTYLLKNQMEFYAAQHLQMPLLTVALWRMGQVVSSPWSWLLVTLAILALGRLLLADSRRESLQRGFQRVLNRLPGLGPIARLHWESSLVAALQVLLTSGVNLLEAIPLAVASSGSVLWREREPATLDRLRQGESLARSLVATELTSRITGPLLKAGEEAGQTPAALGWIARVLEEDFEMVLQRGTTLLEPLIMAVMGVVVGLVTLASLLPSIRYMEQL